MQPAKATKTGEEKCIIFPFASHSSLSVLSLSLTLLAETCSSQINGSETERACFFRRAIKVAKKKQFRFPPPFCFLAIFCEHAEWKKSDS